MRYRLTYLTAPYRGLTTDVDDEILTLGRAPENDLVVDEAHVSAYHARFRQRSGRVYLEDLGSTNGTFVNGKRVKAPVPLTPDAAIQLGSSVKVIFTPLGEEFGDRTLISLPQADQEDALGPAQVGQAAKRSFPVWLALLLIGLALLCLAMGGIVVWLWLPKV